MSVLTYSRIRHLRNNLNHVKYTHITSPDTLTNTPLTYQSSVFIPPKKIFIPFNQVSSYLTVRCEL